MMAGKLRIKPRFHCILETSSQESPSFKLYFMLQSNNLLSMMGNSFSQNKK